MTADAPMSVLCVDDDADMAALIATFLERADADFETEAVAGAASGLEVLDERPVDCIVSDYDMPGLDGLEFLEAVRVEYPDLPFVLFTGRGNEEIASDAISAGVTDYMQKGTGTDQYAMLARRVRNAVERYRASQRAETAKARARTILEASPDAILVSVDGEYAYVNDAAVSLFDAEREADLLGTHVTDLVAPEDAGAVADAIDTVQSGVETVTRVRRMLETVDGEPFPAEVTGRDVDWEGESGIVAIIRDLSETEAVERGRDRYLAAFEEALDAMIIADDDGSYVDANERACDLLGLSRADLLGKTVADFAPEGYDVEGEWAAFIESEGDRGTFPLESADGERRTVEYAASANVVPGEHLAVLRDVTERAELESELRSERAMLQALSRITSDRAASFEAKREALLDLGQDFLDVPYGFLTEIDDGTQTVVAAQGDHAQLQTGESCPLSEAYCRKTVASDSNLAVQNAVEEGWYGDPAYERFELGCYLGAKIAVDGDLYGTVCFAGSDPREEPFSDTDRTFVDLLARWTSYELERQRHRATLERQNARLEKFAGMVSHDLRSPLSVALGRVELVREERESDHLVTAVDALDRMDALIDDLLTLVRGADLGVDREPVDLAALAEESWTHVAPRTADLVVEDPPRLLADRGRLTQVLENLFRNAVDHAGDAVTVCVGTLSDARGFYVEDDGSGIPASEREAVFDVGYTTSDDGTGFGLPIVAEAVAAHDWDVSVTEGADGGTRFEVTGVESADA